MPEKLKATTIYFPIDLLDRLTAAAKEDQRSLTSYVVRLLERAVGTPTTPLPRIAPTVKREEAERRSRVASGLDHELAPWPSTDAHEFVSRGQAAQSAVDTAIAEATPPAERYSVRPKRDGFRIWDMEEGKLIAGTFPTRQPAEVRCTELNAAGVLKVNGKWPASRTRLGRAV